MMVTIAFSNRRNHFHHENSKKPGRNRTLRKEAFGTNKGRNESKIDSLSSQNTKRDPDFRQRKVQAFSANENPVEKTIRMRQKRENLRKGQAAGDTDGATMAQGSQAEGYSNFLSRVSNFFFASRRGRWDGGSHDYQNRNERTLHAPHVRGRMLLLRNLVRTLL
nr:hypothetical protein [Tanacetum cinerariifolium]